MKKTGIAIIDHVGIKAGMDCYDLELYSAFKRTGYPAFIYSNFTSSEINIKPVFRFRVKENVFSFLKMIRIYLGISSELKKNNFENCILHCFRFGFWEWIIIRIIKRSDVRVFLIVHDPESLIGNRSALRFKTGIFDAATGIVVHNQFSFDQVKSGLSEFNGEKLTIIPHGNFIGTAVQETDIEKFRKRYSFREDNKYILFLGQIKESKGLDLLIDALPATDSSIRLVIAGRMRKHSFEKYQNLIDKNKLNDKVSLFIDYVDSELRNNLFHLADVVVIPYRKIYQSGVMLMAMSYGKAVIASDILPNKETITDNENGFLFESENKEDLSRVLKDVMNDDAKREKIGMEGLNYVTKKLDWNIIAGKWINLFQK